MFYIRMRSNRSEDGTYGIYGQPFMNLTAARGQHSMDDKIYGVREGRFFAQLEIFFTAGVVTKRTVLMADPTGGEFLA